MKAKLTILSLMIAMTGCVSSVNNGLTSIPALTKNSLNKNELLKLFSGSTVYQYNNNIVQVGFYSEDNTMTGNVWGSWESHIDKGNWMISDSGRFCNQWAGLWSKGEGQNCYNVYAGDEHDQFLMVPDSASNLSAIKADVEMITIIPGDANEFE